MADDVDSDSVSSAVTDVSGIVVFKERLKKLSETANGLLESIDKVILKSRRDKCPEKSADGAIQNDDENAYKLLDQQHNLNWGEYHEVSYNSPRNDTNHSDSSYSAKQNEPATYENDQNETGTDISTKKQRPSRLKNRNKSTQTGAARAMSNKVFIDDIEVLLNKDNNEITGTTAPRLMPLEQHFSTTLTYDLENANFFINQSAADKKPRPRKCHCGKKCQRARTKHRQHTDERAASHSRSAKEHSKGSGDFVPSHSSSKIDQENSQLSSSMTKESIPNAEFVENEFDSIKMCSSKVYSKTGNLTTSNNDSTTTDMKDKPASELSQRKSCRHFATEENSSQLTSFSIPFSREHSIFSDFKDESKERHESESRTSSEVTPKLAPMAAYSEEVSSITEECTSSFENHSGSSNSKNGSHGSENTAATTPSSEKIKAHSLQDFSGLSLKPDRIEGYGVMNLLKSVSSYASSERFATTYTNMKQSGVCSPNTSGLGKSSASQSSVSASFSVSHTNENSKQSEFATKTSEKSFTSTNSFIKSIKTQKKCSQCETAKNCKFSLKHELSDGLSGSSSDSLYSAQRYTGNHESSVTENIYSRSYSNNNAPTQVTRKNTQFDAESNLPEVKSNRTSLDFNSSCSKRSVSFSEGSFPLCDNASNLNSSNYQTSTEKNGTELDRHESSCLDAKTSGAISLYNTSAYKTDNEDYQDYQSKHKFVNDYDFSGSAIIEKQNKQRCLNHDLKETYSFIEDQPSRSVHLKQYEVRTKKLTLASQPATPNESSRAELVCIYTDFLESDSESIKSASYPLHKKCAVKTKEKIYKEELLTSAGGSSIIEMVWPSSVTSVEEFPTEIVGKLKPKGNYKCQNRINSGKHPIQDDSEMTASNFTRTSASNASRKSHSGKITGSSSKYAHRETLSYTGSTLSRQLQSEGTEGSGGISCSHSERSLLINNMPPLKHRAVFDFNSKTAAKTERGLISGNGKEARRSKKPLCVQNQLAQSNTSQQTIVSTASSPNKSTLQKSRKNKRKMLSSSQRVTSWLSSEGEIDSMGTNVSNNEGGSKSESDIFNCSCNVSLCDLDTNRPTKPKKINASSGLHVSSSMSSELDSEVAYSWDHSSRKTFNQSARHKKSVPASSIASPCSCGQSFCSKERSGDQECSSTVVTPSSRRDSEVDKPSPKTPDEGSDTRFKKTSTGGKRKTASAASPSEKAYSFVTSSCVKSPSASSLAGNSSGISQKSSCKCKNSSCLHERSEFDSASASSLNQSQVLKQTPSSDSMNTFACSSAALDIVTGQRDKSNSSETGSKTAQQSSCSCVNSSCLTKRSSLDVLSTSQNKQSETPGLSSSSVYKSGIDCSSAAPKTDPDIVKEKQNSNTEGETPMDSTCSCANTSCLTKRSSVEQRGHPSLSPSSISKASLICSGVTAGTSENFVDSSKSSKIDCQHIEESLSDESEKKKNRSFSLRKSNSSCNCEKSSCQQDMLDDRSTTNTENTFACSSAAIDIDPDFTESNLNSNLDSRSSKCSGSFLEHQSSNGSSSCLSLLLSSTINTIETEIDIKNATSSSLKKSASRSEVLSEPKCSCKNSSCLIDRTDLETTSSIVGRSGQNIDESSTATGRGTHLCSSIALDIDADFEGSSKSSQPISISVSPSSSPKMSCVEGNENLSTLSSKDEEQPTAIKTPSTSRQIAKKSLSEAPIAAKKDTSTYSSDKGKEKKSKQCTCYKKVGKIKHSSTELSSSSCDENTCRYRKIKYVSTASVNSKIVQASCGQTSSTSCSACERLWNDESLYYTSDESSLIVKPENALNTSKTPLHLHKIYHMNESCSNVQSIVGKPTDEDKSTAAKPDKPLIKQKPKKPMSLTLASHFQETTSKESGPKRWSRQLSISSSMEKSEKRVLEPILNKTLRPSSLQDKLVDPCYQSMSDIDDICAQFSSKISQPRFVCDCETCECINKESKEEIKGPKEQDDEFPEKPKQGNGESPKEDDETPPKIVKYEKMKVVSNLNKVKGDVGSCSCSDCSDKEYNKTQNEKLRKNLDSIPSPSNQIILSNHNLLDQIRRSFDSSVSSSSCANNEDAPHNLSQSSFTTSQCTTKSKQTVSSPAKMSLPSSLKPTKNAPIPLDEETCDISEFEKQMLQGLDDSDGCGCCQCNQTSNCYPKIKQTNTAEEVTDVPGANDTTPEIETEATNDTNDKNDNNQEVETNVIRNQKSNSHLPIVAKSVNDAISLTSILSCKPSDKSSSVSSKISSSSKILLEAPLTPMKGVTESTKGIENIKNKQPEKSVKRSKSCYCTRCKNRRKEKPEKSFITKPVADNLQESKPAKIDLINPFSGKSTGVSDKAPSQLLELYSNVSKSTITCKMSSSSLSVGSPVEGATVQRESQELIHEGTIIKSELSEKSNLSGSLLSCRLFSSSISTTHHISDNLSDAENTKKGATPMILKTEESVNAAESIDVVSRISESSLSCKFSSSDLLDNLADNSLVKSMSVREPKPSSKKWTGSNFPSQHQKNCDCCKCGISKPSCIPPQPTNVKSQLSVSELDEDLSSGIKSVCKSNISSSLHLSELTSSCELSSHSSWYKSSHKEELFGETGSNRSVSAFSLDTEEPCIFSSSVLSSYSTGKSLLEKTKSPLPVSGPTKPSTRSKICRCKKCGKRKSKKNRKSSTSLIKKLKPQLSAQELCSITERKLSSSIIQKDVKTANQSSDESTHLNANVEKEKSRICKCSKCRKHKKKVLPSEKGKPKPGVNLNNSGQNDSVETMSASIISTNLSSSEVQENGEGAASSSFSSLERCSTELKFFAKGEENVDKDLTRKSLKHKNVCKCSRCAKRKQGKEKTEKPSLNVPHLDESTDKDVSSVLQPSSHAISASEISELGTVTCSSIKTISLSSEDSDEKDSRSEKPGMEVSIVSESVISLSSLKNCSTDLGFLADEAAVLSRSPSKELKREKKMCKCSKCGKRKTRSKEKDNGLKDVKKSMDSLEVLTASTISEFPTDLLENTESCASLTSLESPFQPAADSQSKSTCSTKENTSIIKSESAHIETKRSERDKKTENLNQPSTLKHCNCCKCTGRNQESEQSPQNRNNAPNTDVALPTKPQSDIFIASSSQISEHSTCFSQKLTDILAFSTSSSTISSDLDKRKQGKPLEVEPEKAPVCKPKKCHCRRCLKSHSYKGKTVKKPKPTDELVVNSEHSVSKQLSFIPRRPLKKGILDPSDSSKSTQDKYKRKICAADLTKSSKPTSKQLSKTVKPKSSKTSKEIKSAERANLSKKCSEKGCQCKKCQENMKPLEKNVQKMSHRNTQRKYAINSPPWCSDFSELVESIAIDVSKKGDSVLSLKPVSQKIQPKKTATSSLPWCLNASDSKQTSETHVDEKEGHILTSWSSFIDSETQSEALLQKATLKNASYRRKVAKKDGKPCLCACNTKERRNGYDSDVDEANEVRGPKVKKTRKANVAKRPMKRPPKHTETGSAAEANPTQSAAPIASPIQANNIHDESCQCSRCIELVQTRSPANQARTMNSQKHEAESLEASSIEVKPREVSRPKSKLKPESLRPSAVDEPCVCHVTCEVSKASKNERVTIKPFNVAQAFRKPRVPQAAFNDSFESADSGGPVRPFKISPVFDQNNSSAPTRHDKGEVCICTEICSEKQKIHMYSIEVKPTNKSKPKISKADKQRGTKTEQHLSTDEPEEVEMKTVNLKHSKPKEVHNHGVVFSPDLVNETNIENCPCTDACQAPKPMYSKPIETKPKGKLQASPKSSYKSVISEYESVVVKQVDRASKNRPGKATTDYSSLSSESAAESLIEIKSFKNAKSKLKNKLEHPVPVDSEVKHHTCPCQDPCEGEKHIEQRDPVKIKSSKFLPKPSNPVQSDNPLEREAKPVDFKPLRLRHKTVSSRDENCICDTCEEKSKIDKFNKERAPVQKEHEIPISVKPSNPKEKRKSPTKDEPSPAEFEDIEIKHAFTRVTPPKPAVTSKVTVPPVIITKAPLAPENDPECPCNTCDAKPIIAEPVAVKHGANKPKNLSHDKLEENEPIEVKKGVVRITSPPIVEKTKSLPVFVPTSSTTQHVDDHCICYPCDDALTISEPVSVKPLNRTKPKEKMKTPEVIHSDQDMPPVIEPMEPIEVKKGILRINSLPRIIEKTRSNPKKLKESQCICNPCNVEPIILEPVAVKSREGYSHKPAPSTSRSTEYFPADSEPVSVKKEVLRLRPAPKIQESARSIPRTAEKLPLATLRDPECICNSCDKEPIVSEPVAVKAYQKEKNHTAVESEPEDEEIEPIDVKKASVRLKPQRSVAEKTKSPPMETNFETFGSQCICDPCAIERIRPEQVSVKPRPTKSYKPKSSTTDPKLKDQSEVWKVEPIEVKKKFIPEKPSAVLDSKSLPTVIPQKGQISNNDPQCSCYELCSQPPSKPKRQPMQSHPVILKPAELPKFLQKPKIIQPETPLPEHTMVKTSKVEKPSSMSEPSEDVLEIGNTNESNELHDPQCVCHICENKRKCLSPPECGVIKKEPIYTKQTDFSKILQRPRVAQTAHDMDVESVEPIERKPKDFGPPTMYITKNALPDERTSKSDHHTHCSCNFCEDRKRCQSPQVNCEKILEDPVKFKSMSSTPLLQRPRLHQSTENEHEKEAIEPIEVKKYLKRTTNSVAPTVHLDYPSASLNTVEQQEECHCHICKDKSKCRSPPLNCEEQENERVKIKPDDISKALQRPKISRFPEISIAEPIQVKKEASKIKLPLKSALPAVKTDNSSGSPCDCGLCKDRSKCQNPQQNCITPKKEAIHLKYSDMAKIFQKPRIAKPEQTDSEVSSEQDTEVKPKNSSTERPPKRTTNTETVTQTASAMGTHHDPKCNCNICESKTKCIESSTQCRPTKSEPITVKTTDMLNVLQKPRIPKFPSDEHEIVVIEPTEFKKVSPIHKPSRSVISPIKPTSSTAVRQCNCSTCEDKSTCRSPQPKCEPVKTEPISTKSPDMAKGLQKPRLPNSELLDDKPLAYIPVELKKDKQPKAPPQETKYQPQASSHQHIAMEELERQCKCNICENKSKCRSPKEACKPVKIEQIDFKPTDFANIFQKPRIMQSTQNENALEIELPTEIKKHVPTIRPSEDKKQVKPAESTADIQLNKHDSKCMCNICETKAKCVSPHICRTSKSEPVVTKLSDVSKLLRKPRIPRNIQDEEEILVCEPINIKHVQPENQPKATLSNIRGTNIKGFQKEPSSVPRKCQCKVCQDKSKCQAPKVDCGTMKPDPIKVKSTDIANLLQRPRVSGRARTEPDDEIFEIIEIKRVTTDHELWKQNKKHREAISEKPVEANKETLPPKTPQPPRCNCSTCQDKSKCQSPPISCTKPPKEPINIKTADISNLLQKPRISQALNERQEVESAEPIEVKKLAPGTKPTIEPSNESPPCKCNKCNDKSKCQHPASSCERPKLEPINVKPADVSKGLQKPRLPTVQYNEPEVQTAEPIEIKKEMPKSPLKHVAMTKELSPVLSTANLKPEPLIPRCNCSSCQDKSKCQSPLAFCQPTKTESIRVKHFDLSNVLQRPRVPRSTQNEFENQEIKPIEVKNMSKTRNSVEPAIGSANDPGGVRGNIADENIPNPARCSCSTCEDKSKCQRPNTICEPVDIDPVLVKSTDFTRVLQRPRVPQSTQNVHESQKSFPTEIKEERPRAKSVTIPDTNRVQVPLGDSAEAQERETSIPKCNCSSCQDKKKCLSPPFTCEKPATEPIKFKAADTSKGLQKPRVPQSQQDHEILITKPIEVKKQYSKVKPPSKSILDSNKPIPGGSTNAYWPDPVTFEQRIPKCNCTLCQDKSKCESPLSGCHRPMTESITVKPTDFSKGMQKPRIPLNKPESQHTEPIEVKKRPLPVKRPHKSVEDIQVSRDIQVPKCNCNTCRDKSKCQSPPSACQPTKSEPIVLKNTDISKTMHKPRVPKSVLDEDEVQLTKPIEIKKEDANSFTPPVLVHNNDTASPIPSTTQIPHDHHPQCSCNTCKEKSKCQTPYSDCQPPVKEPIGIKVADPTKLLQKPKISQPMQNSDQIQFTEQIEVKRETPRIINLPMPVADVRNPTHTASTQELKPLQNVTKCHCSTCRDRSKCMSPPTSCKPIKPDPIKLKSTEIAKILQKPRLIQPSLPERAVTIPFEPIEIKKTANNRVDKISSPLVSDVSSGHESNGAHTSRVCSCMECNESRKRKLPKERFLCVGCLPRNTGGSIACELLENFDDSTPMIVNDANTDNIGPSSSDNNESPCICRKPPVCPSKYQDEETSPTEYKPKRPPVQPQVVPDMSVIKPQHPVHSFKNVQPVLPINPSADTFEMHLIEVDSKSPAITENKSKPEKVETIAKPLKNSTSPQSVLHEPHNDMCQCRGCKITRERNSIKPVEVFKRPADKVTRPKPLEMLPVQVKQEATPPRKKSLESKLKAIELIPVEVFKPSADKVSQPKVSETEPVQVKQKDVSQEKKTTKPQSQTSEDKDCEKPVEVYKPPTEKVPKLKPITIEPIHIKPNVVSPVEKPLEPKFQLIDVNFAKPKCACDDICGPEIPIIDPIELKPNAFKLAFQKPRIPVETSVNSKEHKSLEKVRTKIDLSDKTKARNESKKEMSEKKKTCDCTKCGGADICKSKAEECKPKPVEYKNSDSVATGVLKPIPSGTKYTGKDKAQIEATDHTPPTAHKYKKTHDEPLKGMELPLAIKPVPVKIVVLVETKEIEHKPKLVENKHPPVKLSPVMVKQSPIMVRYPVETSKLQSRPKENKEALVMFPVETKTVQIMQMSPISVNKKPSPIMIQYPVETGQAQLKPKGFHDEPVKVKSTPTIGKKPIKQHLAPVYTKPAEKTKTSKSAPSLHPSIEQMPVETKKALPKQKPSKSKTAINTLEQSKPVSSDPVRKQDAIHGQSCPCQACKQDALPKIEPVTLKSPAGVMLLNKPRIPPVSFTDQSLLVKSGGSTAPHWENCTCEICQNRNDCRHGPKECQTKGRRITCSNCCKKQEKSASSMSIGQRSDLAPLHPRTPIVPEKPVIAAKPIEPEKPIKPEKQVKSSSNLSIETILSPQPTVESSGETLLCSTTLESSIELVFHDSREEYSSSPMSWCSCPSSKSSLCICHRSGDGSDQTKIICIGKLSRSSEEIVETCSESSLHSCVPSCTCTQEKNIKKSSSYNLKSISRDSSYESVIGASQSGSTIIISVENGAVQSEILSTLTESSCLSVFSSYTCKDDESIKAKDSDISSSKCDSSYAPSCQMSVDTYSCKTFSSEDSFDMLDRPHSSQENSSLSSRITENRPSQSLKSLVEVNSTKSLVVKAPSLIESTPYPTEPASPCGIPSAIKKGSKESISTKDSLMSGKQSCTCTICLLVSEASTMSTISTEASEKSSMQLSKPDKPSQKPVELPQKSIEVPCKPTQPSKPIDRPCDPIELPKKPIEPLEKPQAVPQKPVLPSQKPKNSRGKPITAQKESTTPDQCIIPSRPSRKSFEQLPLCPNKCGCPDCPFLQQSRKQIHTERQSLSTIRASPSQTPRYERSRPQPCGCSSQVSRQCSHCGGIKTPSAGQQPPEDVLRICMMPNGSSATYRRGCGSINQGLNNDETCNFNTARSLLDSDAEVHGISESAKALFKFVFAELKQIKDIIQRSFNIDNTNSCANLDNTYNNTCNNSTCEPSSNCPCMSLNQYYPQRFSHLHDVSHPCMFSDLKPFESVPRVPLFCGQRNNMDFHVTRPLTTTTASCYPESSVKILSVKPVGRQSLMVSWLLDPSGNIDGYEVFVDNSMKCRTFTPARNTAIVNGVDADKEHQIRVIAVPHNGQTSHNSLALRGLYLPPERRHLSAHTCYYQPLNPPSI